MSKKEQVATTEKAIGVPGTRRSFLARLWVVLCALAAGEYLVLAAGFMRPRRRPAKDAAGVVVAGPLDRFAPGTVTAFPAGKFYLSRLDDGRFVALSRVCTHLGCTVPWDSERRCFVCPCHASVYDIEGNVISPPAPRPLDTHPVRIENGIVKVDLSQA